MPTILNPLMLTNNVKPSYTLIVLCWLLKGHGHDVWVRLFLRILIINLDCDEAASMYNVHILLTTPTEFTDSRKYAETL